MGPAIHRNDKDSKLTAVLGGCMRPYRRETTNPLAAIATDVERSLQSEKIHVPAAQVASLYKQCDKILLIEGTIAAKSAHDLDARGTRLWNLASKLKKGDAVTSELTCLGML